MIKKLLFIMIATFGISLSGCGGSADAPKTGEAKDDSAMMDDAVAVGYMYTTLNGEGENAVVRFSRYADGTIGDEKAFKTGSKGGANRGAGGDAFGDFDSQNAINIRW